MRSSCPRVSTAPGTSRLIHAIATSPSTAAPELPQHPADVGLDGLAVAGGVVLDGEVKHVQPLAAVDIHQVAAGDAQAFLTLGQDHHQRDLVQLELVEQQAIPVELAEGHGAAVQAAAEVQREFGQRHASIFSHATTRA